MFRDRVGALQELGHETGAVVIAQYFGGKDKIPKADDNSGYYLTHAVDSYTFGLWKLHELLESAKGIKTNPSEEHWLSMNLDFQKGVVKESAIEWAQAVANRDNRPYFVEEDGGMWFVTTNKTPLRIDPVKSNPKGTRMYKGYTIQKTKKGYSVNGMQEFKRLRDARNYIDATKRGATVHPSIVCIYKKNPHKPKCGGVLREQKNKKNYTCMDCGAKYKVK